MVTSLLLNLVFFFMAQGSSEKQKTNIIFAIVDDMGWNDVGWNNPEIYSPNLDALAREGVILSNSYVMSVCSPSRAAILTGYYPYRIAMQDGAVRPTDPRGLPLNLTLLPQHLKKLGYSTHAVGKWHLGFCDWNYTPTYRGFDSFFGFLGGSQDHYNSTKSYDGFTGYDFRNNTEVHEGREEYSSFLYAKQAVKIIEKQSELDTPYFLYLAFQAPHGPLQVPEEYLEYYRHISNDRRRAFSAMVTALDVAVGRIMEAVRSSKDKDRTMIVFISDNGGQTKSGSNFPLRGGKGSWFEGGTRVPTFVWGEMLKKKGYVHKGLIHAVDWLPTLISIASQGGKTGKGSDINGVDQSDMILKGGPSKRLEFIYHLEKGRGAIRVEDYKFMKGANYKDWCSLTVQKKCPKNEDIKKITSLFDLRADPFERNDLVEDLPEKVEELSQKLNSHIGGIWKDTKTKGPEDRDPVVEGVWAPGWC